MMTAAYTLSQLNSLIKKSINISFPSRLWVTVELSEVNENYSGHCYLECIEKSATGTVLAKSRGNIWATTYRLLKPHFEEVTGHRFTSGIKVLVEVGVTFHEVYGFSLSIHDIDPTYTLGDMAAQRAAIIKRLTEEGIITMNKELAWEEPPRRVAVISSASAAGYGDFMQQLHRNAAGYVFYTALFTSVMQGDQAEESIVAALDRIYSHAELFDVVVLIRGGGSTSDLHCFDSYAVASHIAQFPLPVIVGIGHERDTTVLDMVAHTAVKTPTAAAERLVSLVEESDRERITLQNELVRSIQQRLSNEERTLQRMQYLVAQVASETIHGQRQHLLRLQEGVRSAVRMRITQHLTQLTHTEQLIDMLSPQSLLARGYTLTWSQGRVVRSVTQVRPGDCITTQMADGSIDSIIT